MAIIQIAANETLGFTISGGTNTIFGTAGGRETVTISGGTNTLAGDFNAGGDTIILTGNAGQYSVSRSGGTIVLTGPNGTTVNIPAPQSTLTAAQQPVLQFADQSFTISNSGGATPTIALTGTAAGSTAIVIDGTPDAIVPGGGPVTPALTVDVTASDVAEGGSILYTFTLSQAQTSAVTLNVNTVTPAANSLGFAQPGQDYTPVATQVTFPAGQTVAFLNILTTDDQANEPNESVSINVTGVPLAATADVTALITNNDQPVSGEFPLTTGNDTFVGTDAADRFVGAQNTTEPGKLLSANDALNGGGGVDTLELTNASNPGNNGAAPNQLADADLTNVTNIETLVTNYQTIQLGAEAAQAGIVTVDTRLRTDAQNVAITFAPAGTTLDLSTDANGDGAVDFTNVLNVVMGASVTDTVRLNLAATAGSSIDTGGTFLPTASNGNPNPVPFGTIDNVVLAGQVNPVRLSFVSGAVGNSSAVNNTSASNDGLLALQVQSEDTNDALVGGITRFDDEGIRFTGGQFDVRDPFTDPAMPALRGTFNEVVLGTSLNDAIGASAGSTNIYINAGAGDDTLNGTVGADFLVGGAGNDRIFGGQGVDSILGGAGNDFIQGGGGIDVLLNGGEGSDVYFYDAGELVANEVINDNGTGATDVDFIAVTSDTAIGDGTFVGRQNIEGLATNVRIGTPDGTAEVVLGTAAEAAGIRTVVSTNDDLTVTYATNAVSVFGFGNITTTAQGDIVSLQGPNPLPGLPELLPFGSSAANFQFANPAFVLLVGQQPPGTPGVLPAGTTVNLGAGNDTLNVGYALTSGSTAVLNGGDGAVDTLTIGAIAGAAAGAGLLGAGVNFTSTGTGAYNVFGAGSTTFTNFEFITLNGAGMDRAASYTLNIVPANVATGGLLTIIGTALRSGVTVTGAAALVDEVLTVSAATLDATRAVNVTGGDSGDSLTGGAGNDTLSGGLGVDTLIGNGGVDTIIGGEGNDLITGGAGDDILAGDAGNDTYFYLNGELTATDRITDTGGTDTINVANATAIGDAVFALKSGVEVLTTNIDGGQNDATDVSVGTLARQAGIVTVNAGNDDVSAAGYDADGLTINIGSGVGPFNNAGNVAGSGFADIVVINPLTDYAAAGSISLGDGNDTLRSGFTLSNQSNSAAATATLNGGAGANDVIEIGGSGAAAGFAAGFAGTAIFDFAANAGFAGWERLNILASDVGTVAAPGTAPDFEVRLGGSLNAAGAFIVDATALTGTIAGIAAPNNTQTLTLVGGTATTVIDVTGGGNADILTTGSAGDILRGGAGNDTLTGGAGFDDYQGGDGDDTIVLSVTEFNNDNDRIDGGEGAESTPTDPLRQAGDTLLIRGTQDLPAGGAVQEVADVGFSTRIVTNSIEQITLEGIAGGNTAFNYTAGFFSQSAGVNVINVGARANGSTVSIANYTTGGPLNFTTPSVTVNDVLVASDTIFLGSNFADTFNLGVTNTTLGGGVDVVRASQGDDTINFGSTLTVLDVVEGGAGSDTLNVSGSGLIGSNTTQTINLQATVTGGVVTSGIFSTEVLNLAAGAAFADNAAPVNDVAGSATSYVVNVSESTFDGAAGSVTVNGSGLRAGVILTLTGGQSATTGDETLTVNGSSLATNFVAYSGGGALAQAGNGGTTAAHAIIATGGGANDVLIGGSIADTLIGGVGNDRISGGAGVDTIDGGTGDDQLLGGAGNDIITAGTGADTITGGLGADTINLGNDASRDTVIIAAGDAPRADPIGIETLTGFTFDTDAAVGLAATADVILLTYTSGVAAAIIDDNSPSITNGVVQQGSVLQSAINSSTSLLAAIQLIEQEFNADPNGDAEGTPSANDGVVAFTYGGNTYVGVIEDTDPTTGITEAFTSIVQINGIGNVTQLIDAGGGGFGLSI